MGTGAGIPLQDRHGPTKPPPDGPAAAATSHVDAPPGTPCWLTRPTGEVGGIVLGWQQDSAGSWWALVSAWVPRDDVRPR